MNPRIWDEKFAHDQMFIQHDFSSFNMIFLFVCYFCVLLNRSNIHSAACLCYNTAHAVPISHCKHGIFIMLDEMLDRFNKPLSAVQTSDDECQLQNNFTQTGESLTIHQDITCVLTILMKWKDRMTKLQANQF